MTSLRTSARDPQPSVPTSLWPALALATQGRSSAQACRSQELGVLDLLAFQLAQDSG